MNLNDIECKKKFNKKDIDFKDKLKIEKEEEKKQLEKKAMEFSKKEHEFSIG